MHHSVVAAKHRSERLNASLDSASVFSFQCFSFLLFFHAFQGNKIYCSQLQHHCLCTVAALFMHCLWDPQLLYSEKKLKIDPTILFTLLKIILLQYFQFLVSAKISSIQTDP